MCSLQSEPVRVDDPGEDGPEEHTVEYHLHRKREEQAHQRSIMNAANTHLFWLIGGMVLRVVMGAYRQRRRGDGAVAGLGLEQRRRRGGRLDVHRAGHVSDVGRRAAAGPRRERRRVERRVVPPELLLPERRGRLRRTGRVAVVRRRAVPVVVVHGGGEPGRRNPTKVLAPPLLVGGRGGDRVGVDRSVRRRGVRAAPASPIL